MKRVLLVTHVSGFVPQFEMNNVRILHDLGYEVHYASNFKTPVYGNDNQRLDGTGIIQHQVDFIKSPFNIYRNIIAYFQMRKLMKYEFDLIHCHTPMGGVIARLAARGSKKTKVIYTAHGFHFYHGASLINWLLYYPAERLLARLTDILITINEEDFQRAKSFKLKDNGRVYKVNGVGIDIDSVKNTSCDRMAIRKLLGIYENSFALLSVGELSKRKNHSIIVNAMSQLKNSPLQLVICGQGAEENKLRKLVSENNLENNIIFAGYRNNIPEIMQAVDCFIFPSLQEGLSVALMEAMAAGLPVICSNIRGNTDLIKNGEGGYLISPKSREQCMDAIKRMATLDELSRGKMGYINQNEVKNYNKTIVQNIMREIYVSCE